MHLDVIDLRNFYYRTRLGRAAQTAVRNQVVALWPDVHGQTVVGFGFAVPMLRPFLADARRVVALMPSQQGVMHWPAGMANIAVLCEETLWPLETGHADRIIVMHGLETSDEQARLLDEVWRVLGPGGRALFVVPNRAGLWSRSDATPFGQGRPYSMSQLESQLKAHAFVPERVRSALYQPPSQRRFWLRTGLFWEKVGHGASAVISGGVLMVEASKRVNAPTRVGLAASVKGPLAILEGIGKPEPKPV